MAFDFLSLMDGFGTVAFALTGCLVAASKRADLVGFWFLAIVTGVGGGTIRDTVLGLTPVFWVRDPTPLILCSIVAIGSFFAVREGRRMRSLLIWADALGLAFFAVVGTAISVQAGAPWFIAVLLGTLTGVGGGIIRDVLADEPTLILRREVYASACVIGALCFIALYEWLDVSRSIAMWGSVAVTFVVRGLAIWYRWNLPGYDTTEAFNRRRAD